MLNNFAIFILSHGRANDMETVKAIQKAGYTGEWFIVIDDLDSQQELYKEKYGDKVIIFDKKLWAEKTDTITNTGELSSPVFARNAITEIAKEKGLKYYAEFDDDLKTFQFRYNDNGKLAGKPIKNLNEVIEAMLEFQEASGATSLGFASGGGFIGGVEGRFKQGILRNINQAFILRTDKPIEFKGLLNEDSIALEFCNSTGRLAFELCAVTQTCPARSTNEGGLNDLYKENDEYVRAFYSIIAFPNNLKIIQRQGTVTLQRKTDTAMPKIISERWKKNA